ncbi:VWA domain-containing protein [Acidobacteria bacterium AH-259-D05]|nr:VWA domain-containing protein [Acidobacteria bacterium AH-259-D05]
MQFAQFNVLYILIGVFLLLGLIQWLKRSHYLAHSLVSHSILASMRPSHLRFLPRIFLVVGVVAAGIALMEPRITFREGITELEGLDIVMVVDLSSSMQEVLGGWEEHREFYEVRSRGDQRELPMPETRMQAVQRALFDFVSRRDDDRLALVTFSENSYVVSPLTTDRSYLEKYIVMIDPAILIGEGMTAIGEGIDTAIGLFRREDDPETKNKVIVVFTDGEHNYGRDPIDVLGEARFYGYRVYLIGVELGSEITRKQKVQQLIQAVNDTGGQYFDARDKNALEEAYLTIDQIEKGVFVQKTLETNVPAYQIFLYSSLGLLFVGLFLNSIPYFVEIS